MEGEEELARRSGKQRGWGRAPSLVQGLEVRASIAAGWVVGRRDRAAMGATD